MLYGKNVVLGVSGGIAVYKACEIVSRLKKLGANVDVIMTDHATEFVTPLTFQTLAKSAVVLNPFEPVKEFDINHISLARENDIVLAISKSGSSRRVMDAMKLARDKKLKMILISADRQSPAAALADYVLDSGGGVRLDFEERKRGFSYLNEFITAEALIEFVANATQIRQDHAERMEWFLAENKL